jgi:hypothetical protein
MPTFLRVLATAIEVLERESGRGREVPCSRSKERKSPGVDQDLKSEKVTTMGGSKAIAIDAEQRDTSPIHATPPPNTLLAQDVQMDESEDDLLRSDFYIFGDLQ